MDKEKKSAPESNNDQERNEGYFSTVKQGKETSLANKLRMQEEFTLREGYRAADGEKISAIRYRADFTYYVNKNWFKGLPVDFCFDDPDYNYWAKAARTGDPVKVIEDVKSPATRTKEYRMKYKLMADLGYRIREV